MNSIEPALRGDKKDVRYFEYFSAEIECLALEIDRNMKKAEFLFPSTIAKMMDLGNYPKLTDMLSSLCVMESPLSFLIP